MRLPTPVVAAVAFGAVRLLSATWRFRRIGPPPGRGSGLGGDGSSAASGEPPDHAHPVGGPPEARQVRPVRRPDPLPPAVFALWHAHQLPLAALHAGQGVVALASRHRDGEILSRVLRRLGTATVRGSSSRGGSGGLRAMIRAGRAGRPLAFTPDGPRGPARRCKPGVVLAAAASGRPIIPVAVAARRAWRLSSWDAFLVPAPGTTIYVAYGPPLHVPPGAAAGTEATLEWTRRVGEAIEAQEALCAARAEERADVRSVSSRAEHRPPFQSARRRAEDRVRRAWSTSPGPALRGAGALFGFGVDLRNAAYDAGLLRQWRAPLPVVSVGGLTVGGSGKTPVAGTLARWLADLELPVAILTRGYEDELQLHRWRAPWAMVLGEPDRLRAARAAAARGARVAVLDDGFQHRRLARDLEVVLLDLDALRRAPLRRLPAGPFRDRLSELARTDALVITRRAEGEEEGWRLARWLVRRLPDIPVARLRLEPGALEPVNDAARAAEGPPRPILAVAGVMKPRIFFEQVARRVSEPPRAVALEDHATPSATLLRRLAEEAGGRGIVCTGKDVSRLRTGLPAGVPLWFLQERLRWEEGESALRSAVEAVGRCAAAASPAPTG